MVVFQKIFSGLERATSNIPRMTSFFSVFTPVFVTLYETNHRYELPVMSCWLSKYKPYPFVVGRY